MTAADTITTVHEPSARRNAAYATAVDPSSVASGLAAREWHPAPGELVSLWDMLRSYATHFVQMTELISELAGIMGNPFKLEQLEQAGVNPNLEETHRNSLEQVRSLVDRVLKQLEIICGNLPLKISLLRIARLRSLITDGMSAANLADMRASFADLNSIIQDELQDQVFLFVPSERAAYWSDSPLFDKKVEKRLPKAVDDMVEAGKCLAVSRDTACVFHLMRVVEIGAKRLAKTLKLTLSHKATLGVVIAAIGQEVTKMPTTTQKESDRKTAFSEAADHLNHVKDGWRNKTMHPGLSYTEDQATLMFNNVREFMNLLIDLK